MANNKSNLIEEEILKYLLTTQAAFTRPSSFYIALGTAGTDGSITEPVSTGYTRLLVSSDGFVTVGAGKVANPTTFEFPICTAGWGTIDYVAIMTQVSGGALTGTSIIYGGTIAAAVTLGIGDTARFVSGSITVSEA